jgi:malonyl CoA-acyl carrier protein transacylase
MLKGSQYKGMGKDLFNDFSYIVEISDDILGYSIKDLCLYDNNLLNQTQYTQPALYTVNILHYMKKIQTNSEPDYLAGHSLGEYCALFAAGAFTFEDGLKLVKKRGQLMSKAFDGGMAAILGLTKDKVERILLESGYDNVKIANYNSPSQFIISGFKDEILKVVDIFKNNDAKVVQLNVSGAFHSKLIYKAKVEFEEYIKNFSFSKLKIPVISNYTGRPYNSNKIEEYLISQITSPVKWTDTIEYLTDQGEMQFVEIGSRQVLTKFTNEIIENDKQSKINRKNAQNFYNIHTISEDVEKEIDRLKCQVDLFWNKEFKSYINYGL